MTRAIIPITELPNISADSLNHIRYRIKDDSGTLFSGYSVISAIKRPQFEYNEQTYNDMYRTTLTTQRITITWYTEDISQEFEIFGRYKYRNSSSATYWSEPIYFGRASQINEFSFIPTPTNKSGTNTLTSQAIQALVKIPTYSTAVYNSTEITNITRSGSASATYTTSTSHGLSPNDIVSIYFNLSASTVFDTLAGYFTVASTPTPTTFVCNTGDSTAYTGAPPAGSLTNYAQKVSGKVQFVTSKINFI